MSPYLPAAVEAATALRVRVAREMQRPGWQADPNVVAAARLETVIRRVLVAVSQSPRSEGSDACLRLVASVSVK